MGCMAESLGINSLNKFIQARGTKMKEAKVVIIVGNCSSIQLQRQSPTVES